MTAVGIGLLIILIIGLDIPIPLILISLALIVVIIMVAFFSNNSNESKFASVRPAQEVKTDVASTFRYTCRMLEALDILEDVLKTHDKTLHFYRHIGPSMQTHDTVFEIECVIIKSRRNPLVQEALDSVRRELNMRMAAKNSGEPLPTTRGPDNYTVWCHLTDEQVDTLDDMITDFRQRRDEDNDIVLESSLLLRFDNPSSYNGYTYRTNMYVKALAEAIHEKFPNYGFEASTYGIHFLEKNGVVLYKDN